MRRYAASGLAASTATTIDHAFFGLWVPANARRVGVVRITSVKLTTGGASVQLNLRRTTARGTAGTTVTPTIVSDLNEDLAPVSGALLDLAAYTVQPTQEALGLYSIWALWGPGAAFEWYFENPLWIEGGAGICVSKTTTGICGTGYITVEWVE